MLKGKKIFLRPVESSDAEILHKWENDKSNWQVSGTKKPFNKKEIKKFISNQKDIYLDKQLRLMIYISPAHLVSDSSLQAKKRRMRETENERNYNSMIGCIDLFDFDNHHRKAGIGILIADKKNRRKGYASEALKLLIDHSFNKLHLHQLYCNITKDNISSLKLFSKHKFKSTGKKKDWIIFGKKFKDEYILQLINKY